MYLNCQVHGLAIIIYGLRILASSFIHIFVSRAPQPQGGKAHVQNGVTGMFSSNLWHTKSQRSGQVFHQVTTPRLLSLCSISTGDGQHIFSSKFHLALFNTTCKTC